MHRCPMYAARVAASVGSARMGSAFGRSVPVVNALGLLRATPATGVRLAARGLRTGCRAAVAPVRAIRPSVVTDTSVLRSCGRARRGVATFTRAARCEGRHPKADNPHSRHYTGPGSGKAWREAQAKAALRRHAPSKSRGKLLVFAFAAGTAASVGVMIYNVYLWTRARGVETQSLQDTPLIEGNPLVFFDLEADGRAIGRVVFQLRADVCPITAENFRLLVTNELGVGYRLTRFHSVSRPDGLYAGDYMSGTGDDSVSAFATGLFRDENFVLDHSGPGQLSMDNDGVPHTNGSRFCISLRANPEYNGKRVVFGNVVRGMEILWEIARSQNVLSNSIRGGWVFKSPDPVSVVIRQCGQLGWVGSKRPDPPQLPALVGQIPDAAGDGVMASGDVPEGAPEAVAMAAELMQAMKEARAEHERRKAAAAASGDTAATPVQDQTQAATPAVTVAAEPAAHPPAAAAGAASAQGATAAKE